MSIARVEDCRFSKAHVGQQFGNFDRARSPRLRYSKYTIHIKSLSKKLVNIPLNTDPNYNSINNASFRSSLWETLAGIDELNVGIV